MPVRCKMSPQGAVDRGAKGAQLCLGAVYEGSDDLMRVSENAIFGNSTPTGNLQLHGDFPVEKFSQSWHEEYYVDMHEPGDIAALMGSDYLITFPARKFYQSQPATHNANESPCVTFRYAPLGDVSGCLWLGIKNPAAVEWLDSRENLVIGIKLARGRRSDAEIALREKQLEDGIKASKAYWEKNKDHYLRNDPSATEEKHVFAQTEHYRRKLELARGEP